MHLDISASILLIEAGTPRMPYGMAVRIYVTHAVPSVLELVPSDAWGSDAPRDQSFLVGNDLGLKNPNVSALRYEFDKECDRQTRTILAGHREVGRSHPPSTVERRTSLHSDKS